MSTTSYHKPVLVNEVVQYLDIKPGGMYIDATFGGGGHSRAILNAQPTAKVFAIDWDQHALQQNALALEQEFGTRFSYVWGNFAHIHRLVQQHIKDVDGILADFGTSQDQLINRAGFSWNIDTPLDMRMSPAHQKITAQQLLNHASTQELAEIFITYGQEPFARAIARAIVQQRTQEPITHTAQLAQLIEHIVSKKRKYSELHPATRVFQALRIYINKELENIQAFLANALQIVKPGGTIVCISFHSLEDRLVKRFFIEHPCCTTTKGVHILTPQVITASQQECEINRAARSARLRAARVC